MHARSSSFLLVLLALVVAAIGIAPTFWLLWPYWSDSFTYSHGLLILPLSAWLLWEQRVCIDAEPAEPAWWSIPILGALLLAWTLAFAASIEIGTSATMPLILLSAVLLVAGWRISRLAAFPVLLLYSAIPVWDYINVYLQTLTTKAVSIILRIIQVPAFIEGNLVQVPAGWFEIAGGCSGLHFFVVAITLAAVYAHRHLRSNENRVALLVAAAAMSVVMNWFRVATIITAGHLSEMQSYLVQVDHYYFGWFLFAILLVPFFLFARWLERRESGLDDDTAYARVHASRNISSVAVAVVCVMGLLPALVWGRLIQYGPQPVEIQLPEIAGFEGPTDASGNWTPLYNGCDGEALGVYRAGGDDFEVYVNWYRTQSQGRELIGYGNNLAGTNARQYYDREVIDSAGEIDPKLLDLREIMMTSSTGERRLVWYRFIVGGEAESQPLRAKLKQAVASMIGQSGSGVVALAVPCRSTEQDCRHAREILSRGFADLEHELSDTMVSLDRPSYRRRERNE